MSRPGVLILGGGFAGLACAIGLDARRFDVCLIDRRRHFEFLPNIHELLSGVKSPEQLRLDLRATLAACGHRFVRGEVTAIDATHGRLALGRRHLSADYLVLAPGSADADFGVSGVAEHAIGFKSVAQCVAIGRRLRALRRKGSARIVIIGAGIEGVEALGEILRAYRRDARADFRISVVEAAQRVLPGQRAAVSSHIAAHCERLRVSLRCGQTVQRITAKTVFLEGGQRLPSDLTIWTGGPAPQPLLAQSALGATGEWIAVKKTLEHPRYAGVFVAGDSAAPQPPIPRQAYHAVDMGRCIAENIRRAAAGRALKAYRASGKPTLIAFGDIDTILVTDRVALAGPALAAGKEAVFNAVMTQLDRRPGPERVGALLARGSRAGRELLWPAISDLQALRRQGNLRVLT